MENTNNNVGKFVIVKDLLFSDFMKDEAGNTNTYDTFSDASLVCGMYEFEDVYVMKIDARYTEKISDKSGMMYRIKESNCAEACKVAVSSYEGDGMENMQHRDNVIYNACKNALGNYSP